MKMRTRTQAWPDGKTWVFQGTIAEDATAGTHVCSLTVTPNAGNEMQIIGGTVIAGNTATAQKMEVLATDGTNTLLWFISVTDTSASIQRTFPSNTALAVNTNQFEGTVMGTNLIISGTMQLLLKVTTAAVSITVAFAVVCRIYGAVPTATLADTVGAPALTTNTNAVF